MWQKGTEGGVTDLNLFLSPSSSFVALLTAFGINDKGQIVGFGMTSSGDVHAFLANPFEHEDGDESVATGTRAAPANVALSQSVRRMISGRLGIAK
jgi:probable HAF family extracellular repeat protein